LLSNLKASEELLQAVPLFASLPRAALEALAEDAVTVSFAAKEIVCRQGDPGDSLFVVQSGHVEVIVLDEQQVETQLAILSPGEFFGELALLDGEPRSATARALTDSTLLVIRRNHFFSVLRGPNVLENLLAVLAQRVRQADNLVAARGMDNRKLEEEALTDALTNLGNRRKLFRDLDTLQARSRRYGQHCALAMCDIDNFKKYNDTYGHAKGDEALRTVAQTLAHHCRAGDEVYRYGGEEFLVMMPAQTTQTAWVGMDRMRQSLEDLQVPHTGNPPLNVLTFSAGIASMSPDDSATAAEALEKADQALYEAKRQGRNRVATAPPADVTA
jgi:diguanylate cyclase (GGDEF)-like protein